MISKCESCYKNISKTTRYYWQQQNEHKELTTNYWKVVECKTVMDFEKYEHFLTSFKKCQSLKTTYMWMWEREIGKRHTVPFCNVND